MQKKPKNKENFIHAGEFSFETKLNFSYEKFLIRVEEQKEEMDNLFFFQTVKDSSGEFVFKGEEEVKNKDNFIYGQALSF